jgi:hypothetical protein
MGVVFASFPRRILKNTSIKKMFFKQHNTLLYKGKEWAYFVLKYLILLAKREKKRTEIIYACTLPSITLLVFLK